MKAIDIFRKNGYKQRYKDTGCVIYDLKNKEENDILPDTITIQKNGVDIQLCTDSVEKYTSLGTFSFYVTKELLQAILQKMEEQ